MKYDYNGNAEGSGSFMNRFTVTDIVTVGDSVYLRYTTEAECHIQRITTTAGATVFEHAYGAWANKENLTYVPANEPVEG